MKKRLCAHILTICMMATMFPAAAFATEGETKEEAKQCNTAAYTRAERTDEVSPNTAATGVAEVGGEYYSTVQEAIDAASEGDTVTMLQDAEESICIDKNITLNMAGKYLYSHDAVDVIYVNAEEVYIENGTVENFNYEPSDHATALYIETGAYAEVYDIYAMTVGGTATDTASTAFYVEDEAEGAFSDCEVYYDEEFVSAEDWVNCAFVGIGAYATFNSCGFNTLYGDCCYLDGDASFSSCYFTTQEEESAAIDVKENSGTATIFSGYYYGDPAVWIESDSDANVEILEGEFHSQYKSIPAFGGKTSCVTKYDYNGENIITTPTNWKTGSGADHTFFYEGAAAPSTVKAYLTAQYGKTAGYNDVKATWSKSSNADGYKVDYKKGSGSYTGAKYYSKTATRSRIIKDFSSGYKCTVRVTPYVLVNEDLFGPKVATKCYSNKYKTAYTYTLKKVSLTTFSKSNGKVKVAWKNISGETGYQISKSTKKSSINRVASASSSAKSKLISASKGKYYYYRVRAYKKVGDTTIYGPWSSPKKYKR